jgi:hypothetical protein
MNRLAHARRGVGNGGSRRALFLDGGIPNEGGSPMNFAK